VHGDVDIDRVALAQWLSHLLNDTVDQATLTATRPSGGGWSSDTLLVDLPSSPLDRVVVRLAPSGPAMFPTYDLRRQWLVMRQLMADHMVPVPPVIGVDPDGEWLGRPAFAMGFVPGRVPSDDRPSFAEAGFLFDADPSDQRTFHIALVHALADIHATTITEDVAATIRPGDATGLAAAGDELQRIWNFDRGERWSTVIDESLALLRSTTPSSGKDVLLWGDARPANVVVDDGFVPAALLDWELVTTGPPELDVTWLAEMNRMRMEGSGVAPLRGFLDDDTAVAHYEQRTGRPLRDLGWYHVFSAARIAVLMHRHLRVMVHLDRLPADHRLLTDTVATRRLAELAARLR
jgi:aminoglycoside phosphotransferase (APT) family kinase protein